MQIKTPINQFEQKIFLCKLFNKSNYNTRKWHKTLKDIYKTLESNTKQSPLGEISSYSHSNYFTIKIHEIKSYYALQQYILWNIYNHIIVN